MQPTYYIRLDAHKRTISCSAKAAGGAIQAEGTSPATRLQLDRRMRRLPQPWTAAVEATVFTWWIYDHLMPRAAALKLAHPRMLRAISAAKKETRSQQLIGFEPGRRTQTQSFEQMERLRQQMEVWLYRE
jgi:hypothetical protein